MPTAARARADGSGTPADNGAAEGSAAPLPDPSVAPEIVAPDGVVGGVDDVVVVAVGVEVRGRAEVGFPDSVVFRPDGAAVVVVAGHGDAERGRWTSQPLPPTSRIEARRS